MKTRLLSLFLVLSLFSGCENKLQNTPLPTLGCEDAGSKHAIQSEALNSIMIELENLIFERFYSELDRDAKRIQYTWELGALLDEIVEDTKKIQKTAPYSTKLTAHEAAEFISLAEELEQSAETLKKIAASYTTEKINPALEQMINVCNKCHAKFQ